VRKAEGKRGKGERRGKRKEERGGMHGMGACTH